MTKKQDISMPAISRRRFLQYTAAATAALTLPWTMQAPTASAAIGDTLMKYMEPLPLPGNGMVVATPRSPNRYRFTQTPISRKLHPQLPETPFWAYDDGARRGGQVLGGQAGLFGMVVVAQKDTPINVSYTNNLPATYPAWIPVDTRLTPLGNEVRVMTHLHGGFVAADSDGNPAITPNGFGFGAPSGPVQQVFYPNEQEATLLWFHDHGLGATRLNVFAGLAAAYILRDEYDTGRSDNPNGLPSGDYEIPLVITDRLFNPDGTMLYPTSTISGVTWIGEYFGDVMLVNGKIWPFLDVEPRLYRFRVLNGCNSRILNLNFGDAQVPLWQIGAEGGLFDQPVPVTQLVLAPAERADVLVDFSTFAAGQELFLGNSPPPSPIETPAPELPEVMKFKVLDTDSVQPEIPTSLLGGRKADLPSPSKTRYITLNEVAPGTAGWFLNLNAKHFDPNDSTPDEVPTVDTVEDWVYINLTEDTHPIHVHLVNFQVVGQTPFDAAAYKDAYGGPNGVPGGIDPSGNDPAHPNNFVTGPMVPIGPEDRGFKDTVKVNPGYFATIRARFALPTGVNAPQKYVHHCHIIEHEDNDMMQPFVVEP